MSPVTSFQSLLALSCASSRANRARLATTNTNMPKKAAEGVPVPVPVPVAQQDGPVVATSGGAVTIKVHVKPAAKHNNVTEVGSDAVGVAVAARPTDGEANGELLTFLADILDVKRSRVSLAKGHRSRDKVVSVDSPLDVQQVLMRLRKAAG
ncbi:UPF0235 protein C15orf40 homolog isoform X2 [Festucalex cinctus]